jgi:hypothetical protein
MIYRIPLLVFRRQKTVQAAVGCWSNAAPQDVCFSAVYNACSHLLIFLKFQDVKQLENNTAKAV